ncbi:DUF1127 domain-containing protein [Sulfitobacter aestuarii]|uniref:DUF1127 domain-containing protein n=1 Tax=Sulfitobacter aestuarii TaxID=2161676 RepID=A0ABW5TYJ0_9RHOB
MTPYITRQMLLEMVGAEKRSAHGGAARQGRLRQWFGRVIAGWQRSRMISALHNLDDRLLDDIGLYRADIPQLAEAHFQKAEPRRGPGANLPSRHRRMLA